MICNRNRTESKSMDDLPELPFEKVLSYLSLEDRLKARAVSRRWYWMISNLVRVTTLCYSQRPAGFIWRKRRLVSGAFDQNFICSKRFGCFFKTFRPTILSNLKRLRLCGLRVSSEKMSAFFSILQSFGQLEELDIIRFECDHPKHGAEKKIKLSLPMLTLPMLTSIWLEDVRGLKKLTLDAPRLLKIKVSNPYCLRLDLAHGESVEWLMTDRWTAIAVKDMKNLQVLYGLYQIDSTFLSSLGQLKEIHLDEFVGRLLQKLFEQKQRDRRTSLKIYLQGLLLSGPDDPAIGSLRGSHQEAFRCLAENPSRLADQIPSWDCLDYDTVIELFAPETKVSLLRRFTDLNAIIVNAPVEDTERFLDLLKNLHIEGLKFQCNQPQDLFDRLPEHCSAIQGLTIRRAPSDIRFLFQLKHLMHLELGRSINAGAIRKITKANQFLSKFDFKYLDTEVHIRMEHQKQFKVSLGPTWWTDWREVQAPDLDAVIEVVTRAIERLSISWVNYGPLPF